MAAPEGNKNAVGNDGGRPTEYKESYNDQVYKLCLLGAIDADIANFFGVCEATINNWKNEHVEFLESIRAGKVLADMDVAASMFETTKDRIVVEKKPFKVKEVYYDENGKRCERESIEYADEERVIPADYRSQSLWLRNRKSDKWKDSQQIDHTTKGESINQVQLGQGIKPIKE